MLIGTGPGAKAQGQTALIKDSDTRQFVADVIEGSRQVPVIVDFWAPWCGPCKQLTPILEKVVNGARGAVRLVKVNIDENPDIAREMRIQSIPAVFGFAGGRPVDGFLGALPESQVKAFIDRLIKRGRGAAGPSPVEAILAEAEEALARNDLSTAAQTYAVILQEDKTNAKALAGLARCYIASRDFERARQTLALVPPEGANDPDVVRARAALELGAGAKEPKAVEPLRRRLAETPEDPVLRFELAGALLATGREEEAIGELLAIIKRNRTWNEDAARKQLLRIFDALGPKDPRTLAGRRQLSTLLFS